MIKDRYISMLERGHFKHPLDNGVLPEGREPIAEEIETAWAGEDYSRAAGNGTGNHGRKRHG